MTNKILSLIFYMMNYAIKNDISLTQIFFKSKLIKSDIEECVQAESRTNKTTENINKYNNLVL